ncbi:PAS domain-containing protein, partial [Desulfovibrio sp. OttesenSCG-928-G11]|nr:PAS domain-containing protein [Desulfovibrio sp. OttesenSCG-928-G11]
MTGCAEGPASGSGASNMDGAGSDEDGRFLVGIPSGWEQAPIYGITGFAAWTWMVRSNRVVYSPEWRNILGLAAECGESDDCSLWWTAVHEEDMQSFLEASREVVEGFSDVYQSLFRVRRGDGASVWLLSRGRVVERDERGPVRVCGTIMDVSFLRHDGKFFLWCAGMLAPRLLTRPALGVAEASAGGHVPPVRI